MSTSMCIKRHKASVCANPALNSVPNVDLLEAAADICALNPESSPVVKAVHQALPGKPSTTYHDTSIIPDCSKWFSRL